MSGTNERPLRRRPSIEAPHLPSPPSQEAVLPPAAPVALPPVAPPAPPRVPTDMEGLRAVGEMDPAEVRAMMEQFAPRRAQGALLRGQRVSGRVTRVTGSTVFVDLGDKSDASIDRIELDANVAVGQAIDAFVIDTKDGEVHLTKSLGGDATRELLDEAKANRIPIQGKVTGQNEHGFEVQLPGGVRAFCPLSQMEAGGASPDAEGWVGRTTQFLVIEARGRDAVVSRRSFAEEEQRTVKADAMSMLKEGEVYDGVVTSIREFGAFVKLPNGIEGLVHLSNLAQTRTTNASDVVTEGQAVRVRVLSVEPARSRVNLGIKQAEDSIPTLSKEARGGFGTLAAALQGVTVKAKKKR